MANRQHDQIQWVATGDPASVDMTTNPYPGALGGIYTDDAARQWQLVQGDSTMSVAPFPAAVLWWKDKAKFIVTTSPTALGQGQVTGVSPRYLKDGTTSAGTKGKGNFFFIGKGGKHVTKFIDAVASAPDATGKFVVPSSTAGKADCLAAGTAATYPPLGKSAGPYNAVDAEALVDLDLLEQED